MGKFLNLSKRCFRSEFNLKSKIMENPKSKKDFIIEIKGNTYKIDILKLIFVLIFTTLPIAGIVYLMFKFHWILYVLLIVSYVGLSIITFAKNVSVLGDYNTAFGCCARGEHYNFSKEENNAILKVIASVSSSIIVLLSSIIFADSTKDNSWILSVCLIFSLVITLIELVALIQDGCYQVFIPWFKGEIFKNIKDGN